MPAYGADKRRQAGLPEAILGIIAVLALFYGLIASLLGKSAIHEILAGIYFLIFTTAVVGLANVRVLRSK